MKRLHIWTAGAASALLVACGGGGGPVVDERVVPASATASPAAFTTYVGDRPPSDLDEPLIVDGLLPPTREVDEPAPLR